MRPLAPLVRKLKGQLNLQQPGIVAGVRPNGVVRSIEVHLHGLSAEVKRLAEAAADRDGPFPAARDPVRRDLGRRTDGPSVREMVVEERVPKYPRALVLLYEGRRRIRNPFLRWRYAAAGWVSSSPRCATAAVVASPSPATCTVGKANLMPFSSKAFLIIAWACRRMTNCSPGRVIIFARIWTAK